jgi:hypothetical protein
MLEYSGQVGDGRIPDLNWLAGNAVALAVASADSRMTCLCNSSAHLPEAA